MPDLAAGLRAWWRVQMCSKSLRRWAWLTEAAVLLAPAVRAHLACAEDLDYLGVLLALAEQDLSLTQAWR